MIEGRFLTLVGDGRNRLDKLIPVLCLLAIVHLPRSRKELVDYGHTWRHSVPRPALTGHNYISRRRLQSSWVLTRDVFRRSNGAILKATCMALHSANFFWNPAPGNHAGMYSNQGMNSTRNLPGTKASENP